MKKIITLFALIASFFTYAQTISFTGCSNLFGSATYVFNLTGADATGRKIYQTTPLTGDQPCPSGICEFQISWNVANSRWEFIADDGNGDFSSSNLVFYNTSASTPNPPSLSLGVWMENTATTQSQCGGNLSVSNSTFTGAVQNSVLANNNFEMDKSIVVSPNPVASTLKVSSDNTLTGASVYNMQGQEILVTKNAEEIDFSNFQSGIYLVKIVSQKGVKIQNIVKL